MSAYYGGAIYTDNAPDLLINHCTFDQNVATNRGGAITLGSFGDPCVIKDSTFTGNLAANTSESYGGAISAAGPDSIGTAVYLILQDSVFEDNAATTSGGAIGPDYNKNSKFSFVCAVTNCIFRKYRTISRSSRYGIALR